MSLERKLERLGEQNRLLSEKQAIDLFKKVCNLPPDKRVETMRLFDTLQVPDYFPGEVAYALAGPHQREMIRASRSRRILTKAQLSDQALEDLESQTRIALAKTRPLFPDVPEPPLHLSILPDPFLRRFSAILFPHPINGFPDSWYQQTSPGWPRHLEERPSYDYQLMRDLYPVERNQPLHENLYHEFRKVAESEVPPIPSAQLDHLKFLGLPDEKTFIQETEGELIRRIEEKGGDTRRLTEFMRFARKSDEVRGTTHNHQDKGKRITGESYYCHALASAWLLWTMIEDDIHTNQELNEAVEDVEVELVHDVLEDLDSQLDPTDILSVAEMTNTLKLSYEQRLILLAVKKEKYDDGAHWLQKIHDIHDPRQNSFFRNQKLRRRAARCKIPDRLSNFFTLTSTSEPYFDTLRKLDETYYAFRQLIGAAMFSGLPTFARLNKLEAMMEQANNGQNIWGLPDAVQVERTLLEMRFGLKFLKHLYSIRDRDWVKPLIDTISSDVEQWNGDERTVPDFWQKRLDHLCECYHILPKERARIIPVLQLHEHYGIANFAGRLAEDQTPTPWGFTQFLGYFSEVSNFAKQYRLGRGVILGGVDDLFIPEDIRFPFDFMRKAAKLIDRIL